MLTAVLFSSCTQKYEQNTYFALDTYIMTNLPPDKDSGLSDCINALEKKLSKTHEGGELYNLNSGIEQTVSEELYELIERSVQISESTGGAFDVTLGNVTSLWDFKSEKATVPDDESVKNALTSSGYEKLKLQDGKIILNSAKIDLGGIAKGYIAQKCVEYLHGQNVHTGFISLGGNIAVVGAKSNGEKWNIALKDPLNTNKTVGQLKADSGYISVSGDYERYFEYDGKRYHHIIDPKNGMPADNGIASVMVYSDDGALSDALSTALFVMGLEQALEFYEKNIFDYDAIIITKERYIYVSDGIEDVFTLTSDEYVAAQ